MESKPVKTESLTLETAIWSRQSGDLSVIRIAPKRNLWVGIADGDWRMVVADSFQLRCITRCALLAQNSNLIVWFCVVQAPPHSLQRLRRIFQNGSLLVTHRQSNVSLKSWRSVRSKLQFKPKRWHVATSADLDSKEEWRGPLRVGTDDGLWEDDGATILVSLGKEGLDRMAQLCWALQEDRRELLDYSLVYCMKDTDDLRLRLYYSSFREKYRLAWEDDHTMRQRFLDGG